VNILPDDAFQWDSGWRRIGFSRPFDESPISGTAKGLTLIDMHELWFIHILSIQAETKRTDTGHMPSWYLFASWWQQPSRSWASTPGRLGVAGEAFGGCGTMASVARHG
jgi:hypothetical protein